MQSLMIKYLNFSFSSVRIKFLHALIIGVLILSDNSASALPTKSDQSIVHTLESTHKILSRSASSSSVQKKPDLISLNFQDINIRSALHLLAQLCHRDLIISDKVRGRISLNLNNIPWQVALDMILKSHDLGKRELSNVWFIATKEQLLKQDEINLKIQQQSNRLIQLREKLIQLKHSKASEIAALFKDKNYLLTEGGSMNVVQATNSLWIRERPDQLNHLIHIIEQLDIPNKQILIEARIVNVNHNFERDLGLDWSVHYNMSGDDHDTQDDHPRMDLPNGKKHFNKGNGLALIRLHRDFLLDLELSAIESQGSGKIISSPHLITEDRKTAIIESGEEIPYQEKTSAGNTSVVFKKAVLSLKVTPQILNKNKILLDLQVNQDQPGALRVLEVPAVETRSVRTQVIVEDGETIVLGGIYEHSESERLRQIPFLSRLPIIGALFQHQGNNSLNKELLVFVTSHII
jgi:type IV pilus assembly protein PilQ